MNRRRPFPLARLSLCLLAFFCIPLGLVIRQLAGTEPRNFEKLVISLLVGPLLVTFGISVSKLPLRLIMAIRHPEGVPRPVPGSPAYSRAWRWGVLIVVVWFPLCAGAVSYLAEHIILRVARHGEPAAAPPIVEPIATTLLLAIGFGSALPAMRDRASTPVPESAGVP